MSCTRPGCRPVGPLWALWTAADETPRKKRVRARKEDSRLFPNQNLGRKLRAPLGNDGTEDRGQAAGVRRPETSTQSERGP